MATRRYGRKDGTAGSEDRAMTEDPSTVPGPGLDHLYRGMRDGETDPYQREEQIFPRLSEDMTRRVASYGSEETILAGTTVFERGQRSVDFFLVLDGTVEIYDVDVHHKVEIFMVHGAHQFAGELDLFNDRAILVSGRAGSDARLVRVKRADFRRLVASEPDIAEIMMRAFILRRVGLIVHAHAGVVLIGPGHAAQTLALQRFLTRNNYPHRLIDTDLDVDAGGFLECFEITPDQLPVVISPNECTYRNPTIAALAEGLGLTEAFDPDRIYDVLIAGAGPAGLAAAVYAASEGLDTIVIESVAPGGQAGTSSKIENYLGFPTGISGQALAGRAQVQAQKFGARLAISREISGLDCEQSPYRVQLEGGQNVRQGRSSSPPARATASWTSPATNNSKGRDSITPPPPWRRICAAARKSSS